MRDPFHWARLLAFVTGLVNQELLLRNEYLLAENRILRGHLSMRLRLSDPERITLAEIAKRLGRKALKDLAQVAKVAVGMPVTQHPPHGSPQAALLHEALILDV
jgi:hypothetical protein